jgi:hypothetical protein
MLSTIKVIKYLFLCLIGSNIHVKVTKILRIWLKQFCEYPPIGVITCALAFWIVVNLKDDFCCEI